MLNEKEKITYRQRLQSERDRWYYLSRKNRILLQSLYPKENDIVLQSNDYLCLARHPKLIKAQVDCIRDCGSTYSLPGIYIQNNHPIFNVEQQFAEFVGKEATVLCQSGYAANTGLLYTLAHKDSIVYCDLFAHASLSDGAIFANAKLKRFRHNSPQDLEKRLKRFGPGIIMVDAVYSSIGTICPLEEMVELAEKYESILIVDESHSLGTFGPNGRGVVMEKGLTDRVDLITVSLAKTFAATGGLVAGPKELCEDYKYESRMSFFSTVLEPDKVARFAKTLEIIPSLNEKRKRLFNNAKYLRKGLIDAGFDIQSQSPIVSIITGKNEPTIKFRDHLESNGVFGSVFCYPATPKDMALIRFTVNSEIKRRQLDVIIEMAKSGKKYLEI